MHVAEGGRALQMFLRDGIIAITVSVLPLLGTGVTRPFATTRFEGGQLVRVLCVVCPDPFGAFDERHGHKVLLVLDHELDQVHVVS